MWRTMCARQAAHDRLHAGLLFSLISETQETEGAARKKTQNQDIQIEGR